MVTLSAPDPNPLKIPLLFETRKRSEFPTDCFPTVRTAKQQTGMRPSSPETALSSGRAAAARVALMDGLLGKLFSLWT